MSHKVQVNEKKINIKIIHPPPPPKKVKVCIFEASKSTYLPLVVNLCNHVRVVECIWVVWVVGGLNLDAGGTVHGRCGGCCGVHGRSSGSGGLVLGTCSS